MWTVFVRLVCLLHGNQVRKIIYSKGLPDQVPCWRERMACVSRRDETSLLPLLGWTCYPVPQDAGSSASEGEQLSWCLCVTVPVHSLDRDSLSPGRTLHNAHRFALLWWYLPRGPNTVRGALPAARLQLWPHRVPEQLHQGKQSGVLGVTDCGSARLLERSWLWEIRSTFCDSFTGHCNHFYLVRQRRTLIRDRRVQPLL